MVVASNGYPENVIVGDEIVGAELASLVPGVVVFHAATVRNERRALVCAGGRTVSIVGIGESQVRARRSAYKAVDMIQLRGNRTRRDIGL